MFKKILLGSACILAFGSFAHADTIKEVYNLNLTQDLSLGSSKTAGTITLLEDTTVPGKVEVTVALGSNYSFRLQGNGDQQHHTFAFDLTGISTAVGTVTANNFTPGFALQPGTAGPGGVGSFDGTPYGPFQYDFQCSSPTCSKGPTSNGSTNVETLSFDLFASGLTVYSFTDFVADLQEFNDGKGGNPTGSISVMGDPTITILTTSTSPVPEPSSLVLLGSGLVGAAGMIRRKLKA